MTGLAAGLLTFGLWMILVPILVITAIIAVPRLLVPSLIFGFACVVAQDANEGTAFVLYSLGTVGALYVLIKWDALKGDIKKSTKNG